MSDKTETIDPVRILAEVSPQNRHYLHKLDIFDTIVSTNTYLMQQTKKTTPSGWLCLADHQTAGRGRIGKTWVSPPGMNIYCSLFWRFKKPSQELLSGLSVAVAVMIVNALRHIGLRDGIQLKWPNDIFFSGKKLAGILLESRSSDSVVIGIGLNLYLPTEPHAELIHAISINDIIKQRPQRNRILGVLINQLFEGLPVFEAKGLAPFLQQWQALDMLKNKEITLQMPYQQIIGLMKGINDQGELILQNETGILQTFCYGAASVRENSKGGVNHG